MKKPSSAFYLIALSLIVVVGLVGLAIYKNVGPSPYDSFAQCLTEKGTKMYGAWWCPHCSNQKAEFGSAFKNVEYIECSPGGSRSMSQECQDAGITGYPTWEFADGSRLGGEQTLSVLGERSGCELPTE